MPQVGLYAAFLTLLFPPHLSSSVAVSSSSSCDHTVAPPPSHGDLWLQESASGLLVLIYMGPDGTDYYPQMWGTLSATGLGSNVEDTLCRQLGYTKGNITSKTKEPGIKGPVWISHMHCPPETKHILRCNYRFNSSSDHGNDIHLICKEPLQHNDNAYIGQAALLPPLSAANCKRSRSYGVVTIKNDTGNNWKFLYYNSKRLLSRNVTDTFCREMGFTHCVPNSLWTIEQAKMATSNTNVTDYDFSQYVELDFSDFSCAKSFPCIGCNTKYIFSSKSGKEMHPAATFNEEEMHQNDAMILRCSFYSSDLYPGQNILPGGDRSHCDLSGGSIKDTSICSGEKFISLPERKFIAAFAVPVGFLLLIIIALVSARPIIRKYQDWRYRDYNELRNVRQPPAVQPAPGNH